MENNDRRQRQTNPSGYAGQQGTLLSAQPQYPVASAPDRFRQTPLTALPPTSAPTSATRAGSQSYGYAYGESAQFVGAAIQPAGVSYSTQDYAAEQQRTPQQQQYPQYGQGVMYNVPGQQAAAAPPAQYESVQQYQQARDPSAIEALGAGFGVAQPQYYGVAGEGGPSSAPAPALGAQSVPSQYSSLGYTAQPAPVGRESLASAYSQPAGGMTDPHPPTSHAAYGQQQQTAYAEPASNEYDDFYNRYQTTLKKTFEFTRDSRLGEAAEQLMGLSDWLLRSAETLAELTIGLVRDDETHYMQRLNLWEEFNNCWLTTLQRQKDLTQEMIASGQRPTPPQSVIPPELLEKMGNDIIKYCDQIEKHGLVDYQMGVWEEEIIAMLSQCLDLLEEAGVGPSAAAQRIPSASTSRRR
ncbi:hypothetical protein P154DRAFT_447313 [Amniculicola lignicola CBS 123094]|uniref:Uncharacterized protein n=1 Tax=Amniculicola lignicola CBS 123094 TaxID=1392246 RepID=A0A6A5WA87_9PLEO|nr:hypothetical protein P154DRAFT_447313 [Amniculicola lignicola CBS 123094]